MSQEPQVVSEAKTVSTAKIVSAAPPSVGTTPPTDDKVVPIRRVKKILEADFINNVAGQAYQTWLASVAVGVTEQDCLDPDFWNNVAKKIRPMDRIEVWAKDGIWFGEFRVIFSDDQTARLQKVHSAAIDTTLTTNLSGDSEYIAEWIAPPVKYGVRRKSDREVVAKGFETLFEAHQWIARRSRSVRA